METVKLETVYRSSDEAHLIFLNSIRFKQPSREELLQYFGDRHWSRRVDLQTCVARGMEIAREKGEPFTWLTCTNAGASEVCEAALATMGISKLDISGGYLCDPSSKSDLRLLARPGMSFVSPGILTKAEALSMARLPLYVSRCAATQYSQLVLLALATWY